MSILVKNIVRFVLFVLFQVFVLDKVLLHHLISPYLYFLFILWLPFKMQRGWLMVMGFILGMAVDAFRHTPGFHAAACVLVAYARPFLVSIFITREGAEFNYEAPSITSFGGIVPYMIFAGVLAFLHHFWLFLLEAWQFGNVWMFLAKTILSTALSLGLILITELIFVRKQKFITNA